MPTFTQNWFGDLGGEKNFACLKNVFNENTTLNFLEIGCYEGNAHLWMYENLLKNEFSRSTAIDPFGGGTGNSWHKDVYEIFKHNLTDHLDKITILRAFSNDGVPKLTDNEFDIIYIDGDHTATQTYLDAKISWSKLKKGGVMAFDDYLWNSPRIFGGDRVPWAGFIGEEGHPALGINNFLKAMEGKYMLLGKEYGFKPECKILDLERLDIDLEYANTMREKFNYQVFIMKLE